MELFKIVKDNKKSLRQTSIPVEDNEIEEISKILLDMIEYLKNSQDDKWAEENKVRPGVGLAAPQIGINKNFFAIYFLDENNKEHKYGFINPRIVSESIKKAFLTGGEGCLSVDKEHEGYVYRNNKITLRGYDVITKERKDFVFTGYEAIVMQHEYDHLKGILFYDRINKKDPFHVDPDAVQI